MTPLAALQAALAGEHAAVYLYAVLGAQTSASSQPTLFGKIDSAYSNHRRSRDDLVGMIGRRGAAPVAAEASYALPNAVSSPAEVTAIALQVETRLVDIYGQLVGSTAGADRRFAIAALTAASLRSLSFGAKPEPFPGLT